MKHTLKSKMVVLCGLVLLLSGCTEVAITGRKQFNLVPDSTMNSMGFQAYSEFLTQNTLSKDSSSTQMVKRVGSKIQKAVEQYCAQNNLSDSLQGYQWEVNLIEDDQLNAWAMPGGKMVVYTGLLKVTQSEAGLATVVAHEIAHVFAKHGAERMTQGLVVEMGGMALSKALANSPAETKNLFMQSYGVGTQVGVLLPYSRVHETEADHLGLIFMAMAGYNPNEAVNFWQRMSVAKQGSQTLEILSTHPADSTRIRNIQSLIPKAMQYYRQ
ncbi:MAG: M48 family metallopeptidase [Planctomycetes bacterium]|nr:M48 family metallopeptidase [Planctomycetota bacterium]MBL7146409.1 M48 family metallopeptidase [Phycisphaerae bacterium]